MRALKKAGNDNTGRAYAFFTCDASKREIRELLPRIREFASIPPLVELEVARLPGTWERNERFEAMFERIEPGIIDVMRDASADGLDYAMKAEFPGATNLQAARELGALLIQTYQSQLYSDGETFRKFMVYRKGKKFVEYG